MSFIASPVGVVGGSVAERSSKDRAGMKEFFVVSSPMDVTGESQGRSIKDQVAKHFYDTKLMEGFAVARTTDNPYNPLSQYTANVPVRSL
jgi:hypothetical protein